MKKLLALVFAGMLSLTPALAGEVKPLDPLDQADHRVTFYACETEDSVRYVLDNYQKLRRPGFPTPTDCTQVPGLPFYWVPEYRYLDDEGDTSVIFTFEAGDKVFWTSRVVPTEET